ncbi:hypothetical protein NX722_16330 [Endozoicomonas gorgoniicola]|uniref:Uncharacterized protein n=1 Tax=Endozoicomonas gorgoniicola TaxID=1234144 RepID=A0ABT3MYI7_9GAMM|nr:hypothetical protein [Endozoicomonas gorgoniicola]MCW7554158.1 hypothetical protein [Endozoicomonas gorgoniicola]
MAKISRSWQFALPLLGSLGSMPVSAMTAEECVEFQKQSDKEKFEELMAAQNEFITSLRLDLHSEKFKLIIRAGTETGKYHELFLQEFPDKVKALYPQFADKIPELEATQNKVETVARCYMYGRVDESDPPILRWRYYRLGETDKPLVGYVRPDPDVEVAEGEKVPEIGYVTDGDSCREGACDFRTIKLDDVKDVKKDVIRLVYRFKPMSMAVDSDLASEAEVPITTDGKKWAKETSLIKLKLKRTGEWFGSPEIYFLVLYYKDGKFVRMDTVNVDWAIEKGVNVGNTKLLLWKGTDQVKLVLKERDLNIPFVKVFKIAFAVITYAVKAAGIDTPFLEILSDGVKTLPENIDVDVDPSDITVRGELDPQHKATYLDDIKLDRIEMKADEDTYPMARGDQMTIKSTMYSDVETFSPRHDEH